MLKDDLEFIYRKHHERGKRYGYLYCHGSRGVYLEKWIGQGKKVLDLGCRDGMLTSFYVKGNQVIGADIDRKALDLISQKLSIETFWVDLNHEWPFAPESFDVIVACEIVEHLFFADLFLDKVKKTLKPGGLFIGSVPNAFRMRNRWKFLFGNEYETDPTHVRQYSFHSLQRTLQMKFCDVEIVPLQGKVFPFLPVSQKLPLFVNRLFARDFLWRSSRPL
jgi:2-polyprenyl-3-methyl-5-hydroxy-6-metoxy-1,4-benzoquinol methylase